NWSRPPDEVSMLMSLLERSVNAELPELMARNARLRVLGRTSGLPAGVRRGIDHVVHETRNNTGLTVLMAFNYGARDELLDAFRSLARQVLAGELKPEDISEKKISESLYTADIPDPDLLIRTSGEMRISNFLLWQIAYTELLVTPTLWPDFGPADLYRAVAEFQGRTRRFGRCDVGETEVAHVTVPRAGSVSPAWKRIGSSVVLIPLFVWVTLFAPPWVFQLLVVTASVAACLELARMFERTGRPISTWLTVGVGGALTASFATSLYAIA